MNTLEAADNSEIFALWVGRNEFLGILYSFQRSYQGYTQKTLGHIKKYCRQNYSKMDRGIIKSIEEIREAYEGILLLTEAEENQIMADATRRLDRFCDTHPRVKKMFLAAKEKCDGKHKAFSKAFAKARHDFIAYLIVQSLNEHYEIDLRPYGRRYSEKGFDEVFLKENEIRKAFDRSFAQAKEKYPVMHKCKQKKIWNKYNQIYNSMNTHLQEVRKQLQELEEKK